MVTFNEWVNLSAEEKYKNSLEDWRNTHGNNVDFDEFHDIEIRCYKQQIQILRKSKVILSGYEERIIKGFEELIEFINQKNNTL